MNDNLSHMIIDAWESGVSLETLCQQYPHHADAIQQLIHPLLVLKQVPPPPMPVRASQAQADFLRLAQHYRAQAVPKPRQRRPLFTQRWVWATTTILLLVSLSSGFVLSASAKALPGDDLYGIKRWSESVSLVFTPSDEQLEARINLVNERQREIASLVALNKPVPNDLLDEVVIETQSIELALAPTHTTDPRRSKLSQVNQQLQTTIAIIPVASATDDLKHHDLIQALDESRQRVDLVSATLSPIPVIKPTASIPTAVSQPVIAPDPTEVPHIANPKLPPKPQTPTLEPTEVPLPTSTITPMPTAVPTRVPAPPVVRPVATATVLPTVVPTEIPAPTVVPTEIPAPTVVPTEVLPTEVPSIGLPTITPTVVREPTVPSPTKDPGDIKPTEVPPTSPPTKVPPEPSPTKEPEDTKGQPNPINQK